MDTRVNKIPGGYYIKARQIKDSDIAHAPPHVREIWDYLLREANHQGKKKHGFTLERGQLLTTYEDIQEDLHWKVGWRKQKYTKWQCENTMKFLRKPRRNGSMITTKKTTRGLIITILNYDYYQNPKNYESHKENHNESHNESHSLPQTPDTIDKNEKNGRKKEREREGEKSPSPLPKESPKKTSKYPPPSQDEVRKYFADNGYTQESADKFFQFYEEGKTSKGNWTDSHGNIVKNWKQKARAVWFKPENEQKGNEDDEWAGFRERHPEAY